MVDYPYVERKIITRIELMMFPTIDPKWGLVWAHRHDNRIDLTLFCDKLGDYIPGMPDCTMGKKVRVIFRPIRRKGCNHALSQKRFHFTKLHYLGVGDKVVKSRNIPILDAASYNVMRALQEWRADLVYVRFIAQP